MLMMMVVKVVAGGGTYDGEGGSGGDGHET
jgi:hypothetical protein